MTAKEAVDDATVAAVSVKAMVSEGGLITGHNT